MPCSGTRATGAAARCSSPASRASAKTAAARRRDVRARPGCACSGWTATRRSRRSRSPACSGWRSRCGATWLSLPEPPASALRVAAGHRRGGRAAGPVPGGSRGARPARRRRRGRAGACALIDDAHLLDAESLDALGLRRPPAARPSRPRCCSPAATSRDVDDPAGGRARRCRLDRARARTPAVAPADAVAARADRPGRGRADRRPPPAATRSPWSTWPAS